MPLVTGSVKKITVIPYAIKYPISNQIFNDLLNVFVCLNQDPNRAYNWLICLFCNKDFISLFLEKGREGGREGREYNV